MGKSLPIDLLVDITSSGVKDTFTLGKLPTLVITKANKDIPNPDFSSFSTLTQVKDAFKQGSVVDFATEYFGFTSKSGTKCDSLSVYNWRNASEPATLKGAKAKDIAELKKLNGGFNLSIDGVAKNVQVDLTQQTSLTDIATALQTAIQGAHTTDGFKKAVVAFNSQTDGFMISSGVKGKTSTIGFLKAYEKQAESLDTDSTIDIHSKLGLTEAEGATIQAGTDGLTLSEALTEIELQNGNYGVVTLDFEFDTLDTEGDLKTLGQWVKASNFRFAVVYSDKKLLDADLTDRMADDGLIADVKLKANQNGKTCALISSMDLGKAGGNINVAFNDFNDFASVAITDRSEFEKLKAKKLNAPCKFGVLGQDDTIYMSGECWGGITNSINVYVGNMYLKFAQQIALYNMLKSSKIVGLRDISSQNAIYGYIAEVFENGVASGIVVAGATLTTTEKKVLSQNFGALVDDMDDVYNKVSQYGYFFIVNSIDLVKREMNITECYVANLPTQRFVINNFILGA